MKKFFLITLTLLFTLFIAACDDEKSEPPSSALQLTDIRIGTIEISTGSPITEDAPVDKPIVVTFSNPLLISTVETSVTLVETASQQTVPLTFSYLDNNATFSALPQSNLIPLAQYSLVISDDLKGEGNEAFPGVTIQFKTVPSDLNVISLRIDGQDALNSSLIDSVALTDPVIEIGFSAPVDPATINQQNISVPQAGTAAPLSFELLENNSVVRIRFSGATLKDLSKHVLIIFPMVKGENGEVMNQFVRTFYTEASLTPKFPLISDDEFLTLVQQQTFKYFWDLGHPVSGMARERNNSGDVVTTGGTGFGIMSIVVAMHRNFITREQGVERLDKIISFLSTADRFHGAWAHWMNGTTGDVIPFSTQDNGGDLVETSFLIQGMLTAKQYLNASDPVEASLISLIDQLWHEVEWDWYTQSGTKDVLYWHWSPNLGWAMNHEIRGHNETLITYVLAASSPTHPIPASTYHNGYSRGGAIENGSSFFDITLPLGEDYGGPLFFTHYSFLGLDPRQLSDAYADYWEQNTNHTLINRAYVISNPKKFAGYNAKNWGLTASDNFDGYSAHSPTNDIGVISPTAALSSFPYTPEYSMEALKFFYYNVGDRLWGDYGFKDAFSIHDGWYASSYLAIDQGPIIIMIENYRSGLLWDLFMSNPEVQGGLTDLGFSY
jgi:hypothetical protein